METVILVSNDGLDYTVELQVANFSETLKNIIEDIGIEEKIPVNVEGKLLEKIIEFSKYHVENPEQELLCDWNRKFADVDQAILFSLILSLIHI